MHCTRCDRPMHPAHLVSIPPGHVRHNALGLCRSCYSNTLRPRLYIPSCRRRYGALNDAPDPIAVERALDGDLSIPLCTIDLSAAILEGTRRGYSAAQLARLLNCTPRTVTRHRARPLVAA